MCDETNAAHYPNRFFQSDQGTAGRGTGLSLVPYPLAHPFGPWIIMARAPTEQRERAMTGDPVCVRRSIDRRGTRRSADRASADSAATRHGHE